ncbi:nucleoporin NDC1 isoform X2 [Pelobates fuscus]|uniref:nucleoporin NDC1 isoform X2 n=1 Tax=Pelobates fuscus TaxID=191477 RepID=UPI002FE4CD07
MGASFDCQSQAVSGAARLGSLFPCRAVCLNDRCGITMNVLRWRLAASFIWSVLLLPVTSMAFIICSRIKIFHPIVWLTDSISDIGSSYTIFCLIFLCLLLGIHCVCNVQFYTVVPSIPCSRFSLIGHILLPPRVLHSLVHAGLGMLAFWCCSFICKSWYRPLVVPCTSAPSQVETTSNPMCLNEHHLFQMLAGAFIGYSYSLLYFVQNMNYVSFPSIQQFKYVQFRRQLHLLIKHSCLQSLYLIRNFTVLYYFLGYIPRTWMKSAMNLQTDGEEPPLDTVRGLLNLSLFYQTWLSGIFVLGTWHMLSLLFRIFATEPIVFPVTFSFVEEAENCLPNVLGSNAPQLVKYLAFQDFVLLSQYSPSRRQEVFSLSLPGGHPYNWTAISKACLDLLNNMTARLVAYQEAAASNGRMKLSSFSAETLKSSSSSGTSFDERSDQTQRIILPPRTLMTSLLKTTPSVKPALDSGSPFAPAAVSRVSQIVDPNSPWHSSVQSPHLIRRGAKLWSCSTDAQANGCEVSAFSPVTLKSVRPSEQTNIFYTWLQQKQEQFKNFLSKRVIIMYFFSKRPEASSQDAFADAQIHIWALEGLSHLVATSFSEDRMGVVQTSLSSILGTFLTLQEAVEKHFKLPHASSKPARTPESFVDSSYKTQRFALRAALKTAIYRITTTFGEHLHAVPVSVEHRKRLQQFLDFKE